MTIRILALLLTVVTGASGLVYEVTWQRYLATLLGSHSEATAALLGIFLFGLLLIEALPFMVELGVLLDLLVGVFVMGIILHRIQRTFSTISTAHLTTLKE